MPYDVQFLPAARKQLADLPRQAQTRIATAVDALADNPRPAGCVKLAGSDNAWRIRVGRYRVVYEIADDKLLVLVVRVAHRKDIYRGM
jgi:mRNA interferase RelE/StbE